MFLLRGSDILIHEQPMSDIHNGQRQASHWSRRDRTKVLKIGAEEAPRSTSYSMEQYSEKAGRALYHRQQDLARDDGSASKRIRFPSWVSNVK